MTFDRSLLAHLDREKLLRSAKFSSTDNYLVWIQGKNGMVYGSCLKGMYLAPNGVVGGDHNGYLWWPA